MTIQVVTFSPDSRRLASVGDGKIKIWDAATGNSEKSLEGHSDKMSILSFIPGSTVLTSGDSTAATVGVGPFGIPVVHESACKLVFWNIGTAAQLKAIDSDCNLSSLAYSPDGKQLYFTLLNVNAVQVLDPATNKITGEIPVGDTPCRTSRWQTSINVEREALDGRNQCR